jgi:3-oxoadipate enol-lactonase
MSETAEMFLTHWFPSAMLEAENAIIEVTRAMLLATHRQGYAGCYAAVRDMDMRRTVALIRCPTLVIAGQYDTVTLPSHSELISATVPGSRLVILPAVHLSNVEYPAAFLSARILGLVKEALEDTSRRYVYYLSLHPRAVPTRKEESVAQLKTVMAAQRTLR